MTTLPLGLVDHESQRSLDDDRRSEIFRPLGEQLIAAELITPEALTRALKVQTERGKRIGETLLE